jgi:hypothetical protein
MAHSYTTPLAEESALVAGSVSQCPSLSILFEKYDRIKSTKGSAGRVGKSAKEVPYKRTRQMMRGKTGSVTILAARGFERHGHAPTKKTTPPLLKRRYSIDVQVAGKAGWKDDFEVGHTHRPRSLSVCISQYTNGGQARAVSPSCDETEPAVQQEPTLPVPNPLRYELFSWREALYPPYNTKDYLTFGDSTLSNYHLHHMTDTTGHEAWMADTSFNMALEVLCGNKDCHTHGIDIINSNITQMLHLAGNFGDGSESHYDFLRTRFEGKNWIFIPINDGLSDDPTDSGCGTHWSLLVMDRINKYAVYYDSMDVQSTKMQRVATTVVRGLLEILKEPSKEWEWIPQTHSPNQWTHNQFEKDGGACGPFVWKMCDLLVGWIIHDQIAGREDETTLLLPPEFAGWFRERFHSLYVRRDMRKSIAHVKCGTVAAPLIEEHDQVAVAGEDVVMSDELPPLYPIYPEDTLVESAETAIDDTEDTGSDYEAAVDDTEESGFDDETDSNDEDGGVALDEHEQNFISAVDADETKEVSYGLPSPSSESADDIWLDDEDEAQGAEEGHSHNPDDDHPQNPDEERQSSEESDPWESDASS